MPDWRASMAQTFEYYIVDPGTWRDVKPLTTVKTSSINRDSEAETLGSASFDVTESIGECYIRIYLVTLQNGVRERHPLGTFLVQTPATSFNGKIKNVTVDAYTPLLELKENPPPLGYSLLEDENIMERAYLLTREHARAPVVKAISTETIKYDFVSNTNDTWLSFLSDLVAEAKYSFYLDEMGRILFSPKQDTASLQPVWTYDDGNSSILYPEISLDHDIFGVPNVVEVTYSDETRTITKRAVNDDPNSPVSTVSRGREIVQRITNPETLGRPTDTQVEDYAKLALRELSSLEYTISYTHAYCGTRIGDCVRLNYARAGLMDIKAKIISQTISCTPGCPVTEKAVFTTKLWG